MRSAQSCWNGRRVLVPAASITLEGDLSLPEGAHGVVLFAHGSGSSRHSPRNRHVAGVLSQAKLATLLIDLLTSAEEAIDLRTAQLRFDIGLLAERLIAATDWLVRQPDTRLASPRLLRRQHRRRRCTRGGGRAPRHRRRGRLAWRATRSGRSRPGRRARPDPADRRRERPARDRTEPVGAGPAPLRGTARDRPWGNAPVRGTRRPGPGRSTGA